MSKILVGMSGGVDSSVAAALLKEQGHSVEGVFMKNWSPNTLQSLTDCPWEQDLADAERVCEQLGIPFRSVNFEQEYRQRVVDYFLREYGAGRTPNPDIMCNKEVKFAVFLETALGLGAEAIATGHYARKVNGQLLRGLDQAKDQSYFLHTLDEHQLSRALFPVGELTKPQVRAKAEELGLVTAAKKDSQGICFIGHLDLKKFLADELGTRPGKSYLLPPFDPAVPFAERVKRALVVGEHRGSFFYTIGERAGEAIDNGVLRSYTNDPDTRPVYVLATEPGGNKLFLTLDRTDPHLSTTSILLESWQTTGGDTELTVVSTIDLLAKDGCITAQARYQQEPTKVHGISAENDRIRVLTDPIWGVAPGQSLVLYEGDRVWGGGTVCSTDHMILSAS